MKKIGLVLGILLFNVTVGQADSIFLKSGRTVSGTVTQQTEEEAIVENFGATQRFAMSEVERVEIQQKGSVNPFEKSTIVVDPEPDPETLKAVEEFLRLSGYTEQMIRFDERMNHNVSAFENLPPEYKDVLVPSLRSAFNVKTIEKTTKTALIKNYEADFLNRLIKEWQTPAFQRIVAAETQQRDWDETMEKAFQQEIEKNPPSPELKALISEFKVAVGYSDFLIKMNKSMLSSLGVRMPTNQEGISLDQDPEFLDKIKEAAQMSLLFTYRDIALDDLRAYVDFFKTSDGQKINKIMLDAQLESFGRIMKRYVTEIKGRIRELQKKTK